MSRYLLGRGPRPSGVPLICDICERVTMPDSDAAEWWLDALNPKTNVRVCRCPRHISDWPLRVGGVPRSKATWQWVLQGQLLDNPDHDVDPTIVPLAWDTEGEA